MCFRSLLYTPSSMSLLPGHLSINPQFSLQMNPVLILIPSILTFFPNLIRKLNKEFLQTIVMVSMRNGKKYFDRVIYMRTGKIISDENRDGDPSPAIR